MLNETYSARLFEHFQRLGIVVAPGLTAIEVRVIEERYELSFPPDLKVLLQRGVPISGPGRRFPDWRSGELPDWMEILREGILFDVERWFWLRSWGERPVLAAEAYDLAREKLRHIPKLIR